MCCKTTQHSCRQTDCEGSPRRGTSTIFPRPPDEPFFVSPLRSLTDRASRLQTRTAAASNSDPIEQWTQYTPGAGFTRGWRNRRKQTNNEGTEWQEREDPWEMWARDLAKLETGLIRAHTHTHTFLTICVSVSDPQLCNTMCNLPLLYCKKSLVSSSQITQGHWPGLVTCPPPCAYIERHNKTLREENASEPFSIRSTTPGFNSKIIIINHNRPVLCGTMMLKTVDKILFKRKIMCFPKRP